MLSQPVRQDTFQHCVVHLSDKISYISRLFSPKTEGGRGEMTEKRRRMMFVLFTVAIRAGGHSLVSNKRPLPLPPSATTLHQNERSPRRALAASPGSAAAAEVSPGGLPGPDRPSHYCCFPPAADPWRLSAQGPSQTAETNPALRAPGTLEYTWVTLP